MLVHIHIYIYIYITQIWSSLCLKTTNIDIFCFKVLLKFLPIFSPISLLHLKRLPKCFEISQHFKSVIIIFPSAHFNGANIWWWSSWNAVWNVACFSLELVLQVITVVWLYVVICHPGTFIDSFAFSVHNTNGRKMSWALIQYKDVVLPV